jgi:hypothetical protein
MRIYTSDNRPLDFCLACAPTEEDALDDFGDVGEGPDGRGNCYAYDADHPPYETGDYHCHNCEDKLLDCD